MTPERWLRVEQALQAALDCPASKRAELLTNICAGDPELQRETLSLIEAHAGAGDFLEQPAIEQHAEILLEPEEVSGIGPEIGPYEVRERIGGGGMGEVYLARDQRLRRTVVLKVLPPYFASDTDRLRRFQMEARAASALNHANILTVHDVGQSEGLQFIATEYVDGQTVSRLIRNYELTLGEVVDIAIQLLTGLKAAHAAGIIHRDIKPDNIMRRHDGIVKILDFGIAKLIEESTNAQSTMSSQITETRVGALLGTIGYISPEQARGLRVDERSDIWSCGVVLYEMLSGRRPFDGATNADAIVAILERTPSSLFGKHSQIRSLAMMQGIVEKALNKNAADRYQTAAEMLADVSAVNDELKTRGGRRMVAIDAETTVAEVRERAATANAGSTRRKVFAIAGVAMLAVLVVAGVIFYRRSNSRLSVNSQAQTIYTQMDEAERLRFLSEQEQRIASMMGERPVRLNDEALGAIKSQVDRYVWMKRPDSESLPAIFTRAGPYIPVIAKEFSARRIPIVIGIYLPMVESAYKPCFENSAGAKGLFQFLPGTAEQYGVARQEMCDVNKMAPAAAHYIADRMAELGDDSQSMTLVLLSYNRGADSVREALRQLRETDRNYERNFWTLFANRNKLDETFRRESSAYVPAFFAAAIIGENPEAFGLPMPPLSSLANKGSTQ